MDSLLDQHKNTNSNKIEANSSPRPYRKTEAKPLKLQFPEPSRDLYDSNDQLEISWRSIKPPTGLGV